MISLWAIIKLTCRASIRSHIFHLLLAILILTIIILPNTVLGDGTAYGFIQVSLKYCIGVIGFILSLSTIWVGCFVMSSDLESYQIHMVFTKPISRVKVWIGKWLGVVLIHGILLLFSTSVVYGFILWKFYRSPFTKAEKERISNEVLVGRRVYLPDQPDIDAKVKEEYKKRVDYLKSAQAETFEKLTNAEKRKMLREIRKQIVAQLGEVKPGPSNRKLWEFKGVPNNLGKPLYFRYRMYIGKISSKDQRETEGIWFFKATVPTEDPSKRKPGEEVQMTEITVSKSQYPERQMCGVFHEMPLFPEFVDKDGTVWVSFANFDREGKPLYFQAADGPKLLVEAGKFWENYLRAVFIIFLKLLFLAGLACTAGGLLSMPTAVFFVFSYLFIGICASYIINIETEFGDEDELIQYEAWHETASRIVSHAILWGVIPMQKFEVSDSVARGELIEISVMARIIFEFLILRGVPIFLLGILIYRIREMGLIIRK